MQLDERARLMWEEVHLCRRASSSLKNTHQPLGIRLRPTEPKLTLCWLICTEFDATRWRSGLTQCNVPPGVEIFSIPKTRSSVTSFLKQSWRYDLPTCRPSTILGLPGLPSISVCALRCSTLIKTAQHTS